jgi:hypothetical protein
MYSAKHERKPHAYSPQLNTSSITQDSTQPHAISTQSEGVKGKALADVYYLYLRTVCSGFVSNARDDASDVVIVERCERYSEANDRKWVESRRCASLS